MNGPQPVTNKEKRRKGKKERKGERRGKGGKGEREGQRETATNEV